MKRGVRSFVVGTMLCLSGMALGVDGLDLAGEWRFRMDPYNQGLAEGWSGDGISGDTVRLPGSLDENGKGIRQEKRHVEYLSRLNEYVGAAWYERDVTIPPDWAGKRIILFLERVHWESRVWVDGKYLGMQDSLCTPHEHDLGSMLKPGPHRLTLCIDNRVKVYVGMNAHSITEHTQTNWNGVIGLLELRATAPVYIADIQIFPQAANRTVNVRMQLTNTTESDAKGTLEAHCALMSKVSSANDWVDHEEPITIVRGSSSNVTFMLSLPKDTPLWDEKATALQLNNLKVCLSAVAGGSTSKHAREVLFAFRDIGREGTQLTLNGKPYFVRGNLECCIFPQTAHPPMTTAEWETLLSTEKTYGINHIRFHSWCPPEAAFCAADALGVTFQIETPVWTELGTHGETDAYIRAESERILDAYGNHPSFCFLATGNEPSGKHMNEFLNDIIAQWKARDPRRLYTTCSGWPELPASDYHVLPERNHMPLRLHNNRMFGPTTDFDYSEALKGSTAPVIAHELGQWCAYPRYDEIGKYTGVLRAWNFETFKTRLDDNGMAGRDKEFSAASGRLQWILYKADIEAVLRTPGMAGYQLLSVQDFPGQGTALVGFADALWNNKGAVSPEEFRSLNRETIPLLRFGKYVWKTDDTFRASLQIAHFGAESIQDPTVRWEVQGTKSGKWASGDWKPTVIPIGNGKTPYTMEVPLSKTQAPEKLTITVKVMERDRELGANSWNIWAYAAGKSPAESKDILVADEFDAKTERTLGKGGVVLLLPNYVAPMQSVPSAFEPIFWNMQWFPKQRRQLGVLCNPADPALAGFPTDMHTDWQWWELLDKSRVIDLSGMPRELEPIVRVIDDWNTNRPLGAVFETRVGKGRLMVCTLDIQKDLENRPAAAALRQSLIAYMKGGQFNPETEISREALRLAFAQ